MGRAFGVMGDVYQFFEFDSREAASAAAAKRLASMLKLATSMRGEAALMLSGGSTPGPVYEALSTQNLPWDVVRVGLVDDRWVKPGAPGSNESLIRVTLLKNKAKHAIFTGLKTADATPKAGLAAVESRLNNFSDPFDVCVMGMGLDGHTASWFPGSLGLEEALRADNPKRACAINAKGCPVAGDYPLRISLTLPAILDSRHILLFITGAEKRKVWEASRRQPLQVSPVGALRFAGPRLSVYWAA